MKKRTGLVSNSSSSSFVAVGYEVKNKTTEEIIKLVTGLDVDKLPDNEYDEVQDKFSCDEYKIGDYGITYQNDGTPFVALKLGYGGSDGIREKKIDLIVLDQALDLLAEKLQLKNPEKKLFYGSIYS